MLEIEKLQFFNLNASQSTVLHFFIKHRGEKNLTYDIIKKRIKSKTFNRETLKALINNKFVFVLKEKRPLSYQLNETRFKEVLEVAERDFFLNQQKYDTIIQDLEQGWSQKEFNIQYIAKILHKHTQLLKLTSDQMLVLSILLENKAPSNLIDIAQLVKKVKPKKTLNKVRYTLMLLEEKKFISHQKIGNTITYELNDLKNTIYGEMKYQAKVWNERKKMMLDIIQLLEEIPSLPEKTKNYNLIGFRTAREQIFLLLEEVKEAVILDFRCAFGKSDSVKDFLADILLKVLGILKKKEKINVRILLNLEDWLIYKLDYFLPQLIQHISPNFGIKVPIEKIFPACKIIIDDQIYQFLIVYEFLANENGLSILDKFAVEQAKLEFNYIWQNSLDLRVVLADYKITPELDNTIKQSCSVFFPEYNFTEGHIGITGFRKVMRMILQLYQKATQEIWTIIGPIYQVDKVEVSVLKLLAQENFYEELNNVIKGSTEKKVNVKWIRNVTDPHLKLFPDDTSKKKFIDLVLSMYPYLRMKQIDLRQYQFSIIDKKILIIFEYSQQFKLTYITDELILKNYCLLFERIWSEATDIRYQWLAELSNDLKNYVQNTFKEIPIFKE